MSDTKAHYYHIKNVLTSFLSLGAMTSAPIPRSATAATTTPVSSWWRQTISEAPQNDLRSSRGKIRGFK